MYLMFSFYEITSYTRQSEPEKTWNQLRRLVQQGSTGSGFFFFFFFFSRELQKLGNLLLATPRGCETHLFTRQIYINELSGIAQIRNLTEGSFYFHLSLGFFFLVKSTWLPNVYISNASLLASKHLRLFTFY